MSIVRVRVGMSIVRVRVRMMNSIWIRIRITTKNNMVWPPSPWELLGLGLGL